MRKTLRFSQADFDWFVVHCSDREQTDRGGSMLSEPERQRLFRVRREGRVHHDSRQSDLRSDSECWRSLSYEPRWSDPQRITENEVQDTFPVLSPDGKKIVFDSNRLRTETEPINMVDLFVMASDGHGANSPDARQLRVLGSGRQAHHVPRLGLGAGAADQNGSRCSAYGQRRLHRKRR